MFSMSMADQWFQDPTRRSVIAGEAMIAAATPQATLAGYDVLRAGGNAMDAAVAAIAVTTIVEASQCGLGGDCFALVSRPGKPVKAYNGSGRAPMGLSVEALASRGLDAIGRTSPHSVTVPGAVEAWCRLHDDFGSLELERLFSPAIRYAEEGYVVQRRVAQDWARNVPCLAVQENAAKAYLVDGRAPNAGERHAIPGIAPILRAIAKGGADAFYRGQPAADIVSYLKSLGGLQDMADFEAHSGEYVDPITTRFHGHDVYECPPNGQGLAALIIMNLIQEIMGNATLAGVDGIHVLAEAAKIAFSIRDGVVADPAMAEVTPEEWLSSEMTKTLAAQIDLDRATPRRPIEAVMPSHPDTSYVTVVDRDGMAVSLISSIFFDFGSTLVEPKSGMLLQNRGMGFKVQSGHPNCIAPGKRPMHTIIPGMTTKDGRVSMSFGVVGGHFQPVGQTMVLHSVFGEGLDVQEALNRPRSLCLDGSLQLEAGQSGDLVAALHSRGHPVVLPPHPLGGGHGIQVDPGRGLLIGGSDPRRDGIVLGY